MSKRIRLKKKYILLNIYFYRTDVKQTCAFGTGNPCAADIFVNFLSCTYIQTKPALAGTQRMEFLFNAVSVQYL